jgi:predicted CopG family antitoxin
MITTIQLRENVKNQLEKLKQSNSQTFEEVILALIKSAELQRRKQEELLIEGCKVMAAENLRICREWENTDATLDWDCEGLIPEKYLKNKKQIWK